MFRSALVAIPATTAGQKVPVVFHLHGEENVFSIFRLPKDIFQAMEARVTPDLLEVSSGMTASLWLPTATREAGKNRKATLLTLKVHRLGMFTLRRARLMMFSLSWILSQRLARRFPPPT